MKALFLLLLLANLFLFAWLSGWLGSTVESGREPQRIVRQVAPERLRVLRPDEVAAVSKAGKAASLPAGPATPPPAAAAAPATRVTACMQFGDFESATVTRLRPRLESIVAPERISTRAVTVPGWYLVFLPPLPSREEAERTAADLRRRGISDLALIGENSPLRNGIALGSFRDAELAGKRRAELEERGVKNIRVSDSPSNVAATRFELRNLDPKQLQALAELRREFDAAVYEPCAAAAADAVGQRPATASN